MNQAEIKNKLIGRDAQRQEYWFFKDDTTRIYIRREQEKIVETTNTQHQVTQDLMI